MPKYETSSVKLPTTVGKIAILILGVVILGVGLHSHFQSAWNKRVTLQGQNFPIWQIKPYAICESYHLKVQVPLFRDKACPHISMEHYFISVIIICFILSLIGFAAGFLVNLIEPPLKWVDMGYHVVSAVLLLVGGIVYIVSALQIDNIVNPEPVGFASAGSLADVNFRTGEKYAAAGLTILQAFIYGVVAVLIART